MMGIKINTTELTQLLEITPPEQNIMLVGKHGIGKSQIISNYFQSQGIRVVVLFLGQMSDPGDLIGLPHKNQETGHTEFIPPFWFPLDNTPIVLFLDELNRARPEVLQTIMDLTLNKTLAGKSLPQGSRVISAVNSGEEYQLTDLDPALVSRFNVYDFEPTPQEWLLWTDKNNIDSRIINFITENPDFLDSTNFIVEDPGLDKFPDRRAWVRVSNIIQNVENIDSIIYRKAISGIVGARAGVRFIEMYKSNKLLNAKTILNSNFSSIKPKLDTYIALDLIKINDMLYRYIENSNYDTKQTKQIALNFEKYFDFLYEKQLNEVLGHFSNLFTNGTYPKTISFIMKNAISLQTKIIDFVQSL